MDPDMKVPVGLFVSKKRINAEEGKRIKEAIEGMRSDGTLRKILLKYIEPEDLQDYEL
jgi:ABC-type amino acid transport substrate-binding protein